MKKCPYCAEEIQDEAIKCRFCNSYLSAAPEGQSAGDAASAPAAASAAKLAPAEDVSRPPFARGQADGGQAGKTERKVLYSACPSWKAFFSEYFLVVLGALVVPLLANYIAGQWFEATIVTRILAIAIPLALATIAFFVVNLYRRSKIYRISTTNIESEYGILSKKIDVLELWRCRDIRYRQSLVDRILRIAHIDVYTADVTTPHLEVIGVPASRELFEKIRDAIEIQRQARNVYGVIQ